MSSRTIVARAVIVASLAAHAYGVAPASAESESMDATITGTGQIFDVSAVAPVGALATLDGEVGFIEADGAPIVGTTAAPEDEPDPNGAEVEDAGISSIIGDADWYRINPTTVNPQRRVVHIKAANGTECTGFLIDPNFAVTAGHCLNAGGYNGSAGAWNYNYTVTAALNGTTKPYASCGVTVQYSTNGWVKYSNRHYDYGGLKLDCNIGNTVGWFGYYWTSNSRAGKGVKVTGYPIVKGDQMWESQGATKADLNYFITYSNDMDDGQSGGPVWHNHATYGNAAMAINTYHKGTIDLDWNAGNEVTQQVFNNLSAWKND